MFNAIDIKEVFTDGLDHRIGRNTEDHPRNAGNVPRRQQEQDDRQRVNFETAPDDIRVDNVTINLLDNQDHDDHRNQFLRRHRQRNEQGRSNPNIWSNVRNDVTQAGNDAEEQGHRLLDDQVTN